VGAAFRLAGYLDHGRPTPGTETGRVRISPVRGPLASRSRLTTWSSGRPPFCGADEQGSPVWSAEHQRERGPALGQFAALQDFAALGDAGDREPSADPDRALGVEAGAVRSDSPREDPPAGQPSASVDVERGEPAGEGLGDNQRPVVPSSTSSSHPAAPYVNTPLRSVTEKG
jgi:hypothetical protein